MSNDVLIDTILDNFVKGTATRETTISRLEEQGVQNTEEEIVLHVAATTALIQYNILAQVNDVHRQYAEAPQQKTTNNGHKAPVRSIVKWSLRIAAVCTTAICAWFAIQYTQTSSNGLYSEVYQPFNINTLRSNQAPQHDMAKDFKQRNYAAVIDTFRTLAAPDNRERFLAGFALLETGQHALAAEQFNQIIGANNKQGSRLYNDEAEYYLALVNLKLKKTAEARSLFRKIYNDPEHTYHNRVNQWLLTRLGWLK